VAVDLLVLVMTVGFGLFLVSSWVGGNAFPMVSARISMAGNFADCRSPLSLKMSRANSRGTLMIKPASLDFLGVNFNQPDSLNLIVDSKGL
jgi:hypothetical protein